jgi:hypothetical protein
LIHCTSHAKASLSTFPLAATLFQSMDDTTALQECSDLSLEIDELSPATQMFLSSSPSLQTPHWNTVTPTLGSSTALEQPPPQPLPPAVGRSKTDQAAICGISVCAAQMIHSSRGKLPKRNVADRVKAVPKPKSPSSAPKTKALARAVESNEHRDSAEFFVNSNGSLLSPSSNFASTDFPLFSVDDAAISAPVVPAAAPVCTPHKIEANQAGRHSKLLRPSPNVSLFSASKHKERNHLEAETPPRAPPPHFAADKDLASTLQIGPGKSVPAPPVPPRHITDDPFRLSVPSSSDFEYLKIQQFLANRCSQEACL